MLLLHSQSVVVEQLFVISSQQRTCRSSVNVTASSVLTVKPPCRFIVHCSVQHLWNRRSSRCCRWCLGCRSYSWFAVRSDNNAQVLEDTGANDHYTAAAFSAALDNIAITTGNEWRAGIPTPVRPGKCSHSNLEHGIGTGANSRCGYCCGKYQLGQAADSRAGICIDDCSGQHSQPSRTDATAVGKGKANDTIQNFQRKSPPQDSTPKCGI